MNVTRIGRMLALALLLAGPGAVVAGQGGEPAAGPDEPALEQMQPLPRFETALAHIRAHVQNASMRVKHVSSGRPHPGDMIPANERVLTNTARNCCATNIKVIGARLETATEALREIYASHQRDRDEKALQLVYHMGQHVGAMRTDFASFTKASESPAALNALNSMGDEILHLDRDLAEYHRCCADEGSEGPGS